MSRTTCQEDYITDKSSQCPELLARETKDEWSFFLSWRFFVKMSKLGQNQVKSINSLAATCSSHKQSVIQDTARANMYKA